MLEWGIYLPYLAYTESIFEGHSEKILGKISEKWIFGPFGDFSYILLSDIDLRAFGKCP